MADFISKINEQPLASCMMENLRAKAGIPSTPGQWIAVPTYSNVIRSTMIPFRRSTRFVDATRFNFDWHFNDNDRGAVSLVLGGSAAAKENFIISLGSELSDSQGYYIVLGRNQLFVYRSYTLGETPIGEGSFGQVGYKVLGGGGSQYDSSAVLKEGNVPITFTYYNGHFRLLSGLDPNDRSAKLIASFDDPQPVPGNRVFGLGMYGDPQSMDEVELNYIQKWEMK